MRLELVLARVLCWGAARLARWAIALSRRTYGPPPVVIAGKVYGDGSA